MFELRNKDRITEIGSDTIIMGIVNCTPDSFSGDGINMDSEAAVTQALNMVDNGAAIIDVGGESTRPGSDFVSVDEELKRVIPVIEGIRAKSNVWISIDSSKAKVAEKAVEAGADIINDISGLRFDPEMQSVAKKYDVPVIVMHILGEPGNMQKNPEYSDVINEICDYFAERITTLENFGIDPEKIILDPGIGFGKTLEHNLKILKNLDHFTKLGKPLLIGTSRKSFIGMILDTEPAERLEGTIASVIISILKGADIVRVHDVKEISRAVKIANAVLNVD